MKHEHPERGRRGHLKTLDLLSGNSIYQDLWKQMARPT